MTDDVDLRAYFERVGFSGSIAPTLATLQALHLLHTTAIPFENLTPLMGEPVLLDPRNLDRKLLRERRGGYCYEHNLTFMRVLRELGYEVRGLAARVLWGEPEGVARPRSHMLLAVNVDGTDYIADVGFGGLSLTAPLQLRTGVEQETPHETFRITGENPALRLEVKLGEDWRPLYQFDLGEQVEADYEIVNYYLYSNDSSHFRHHLMAARPDTGRRYALSDADFSIHTVGGETEKRRLGSVAELREVLVGEFRLTLPAGPALDAALERIVGTPSD